MRPDTTPARFLDSTRQTAAGSLWNTANQNWYSDDQQELQQRYDLDGMPLLIQSKLPQRSFQQFSDYQHGERIWEQHRLTLRDSSENAPADRLTIERSYVSIAGIPVGVFEYSKIDYNRPRRHSNNGYFSAEALEALNVA